MNRIPTISVLALAALLGATVAASCTGGDARESEAGTTGSSPAREQRAPDSRPIGETGEPASASSGKMTAATLPAPRLQGSLSLEEAIHARRSVREFTDEPLSLGELGQLLWAAQGITSAEGARAAPSAGGTYPLEIYVVAGRVTGLEAGVYRYRPQGHLLEPVAAGDVRARLAAASLDQVWVSDAAADLVVAAVYARTAETYGERGIRYVHLEAGHAAQNLCLQAVALGLGAVTVGAFSDEDVSAVVHLTDEQQPLYVVPVGRPASP